jgi:hypothetical protein
MNEKRTPVFIQENNIYRPKNGEKSKIEEWIK